MGRNKPNPRTRAKKRERFEKEIIEAFRAKGETTASGVASWIHRKPKFRSHYSFSTLTVATYIKTLVLKGVLVKTRLLCCTKGMPTSCWLYKLKEEVAHDKRKEN